MSEDAFIVVLFTLVGALFVGLALPLMLGRVRPNPLYGFRTRETLADPVVWDRANRVSGRGLAVVGVGLIALTLGLAAGTDLKAGPIALVGTAWLVAGTVVGCVLSGSAARRAAADVADGRAAGL